MWLSPGWYPCENKKGRERWFDGSDWTSRTRPASRRRARRSLSSAQQVANDTGFVVGVLLVCLGVTALVLGYTGWALPAFGIGFIVTVSCGNQLKQPPEQDPIDSPGDPGPIADARW